MPRITVKNRDGAVVTLDATSGLSVMENIRDLDASVDAICGGLCSCATCHVYIDAVEQEARLHPRSYEESMMLENGKHFDPSRSRLSCQIIVSDALDGLELEVAPAEF